MNYKKSQSGKPVCAAGGLLWRRSGQHLEIAVVHRSRYGDWVLPKGKLKEDESWLDAAVREVREETGHNATVLGFAGAIPYETEQGVKTVRFWNMTVQSDTKDELDHDEVMEVLWIPPLQAAKRLTHPLEVAILEAWLEESPLS